MFRFDRTLVSELPFMAGTRGALRVAMNASREGVSGSPQRMETVRETQSAWGAGATRVVLEQSRLCLVLSGAVKCLTHVSLSTLCGCGESSL